MRRQALILGPLLALSILVFGSVVDSSAAEPLFYLTDYFSGDATPVDVISADFDGDGVADLAAANNMSDNISVLLGNGDGTFAPAAHYGAGYGPVSLAGDDFDGDGDIDLAVANNNLAEVSVLLGNGDGTFAAAVNYGAGNDSNSITSCDLNGDGDPDLAVANGSNSVSILSGDSGGTFTEETGMDFNGSFEHCPTSVCCADFDDDGNMDLAVAQSATEDWGIDIYLGNGDFTFSGQGRIGTPYGPRSVISADFDGDGNMDLAAATSLLGDLSIILGNGDGTFASAMDYAAGEGSCSVKGADFDLDGDIDLAVANEYSEDISIFLGNGDGTFTSADNYICWAMPSSIGGGDFDNDGDYDLAVANRGDIAILMNLTIMPEQTGVEEDPAGPTARAALRNYPNPFNPATTIRFVVPKPARVRIAVMDAEGRKIALLVDKEMESGEFETRWDGKDSRGRDVDSGVYFLRMTAGGDTAERKIVLLR